MGNELTVSEAALLLKIKEGTVRVWIRTGRLAATKSLTGYWRISRSEIDRALGFGTSADLMPAESSGAGHDSATGKAES